MRSRAFEVNAVDYLLKPFDRKRVVQSVERARSMAAGNAPGRQAGCAGSHAGVAEAADFQNSFKGDRPAFPGQPERYLFRLD